MIRWIRTGAVVALVAFAGACDDDPVQVPEAGGLPADELEGLAKGLHPVVSVPGLGSWSQGSPTTIRLHLQAVDVPGTVQSYQGELRYDPDRLQVREAAFPDGFLGAWNVVEPGVLRFAGVTLEGVDVRPVVELTVTAAQRPSATDFQVVLEEVVGSDADGTFQDLTPQVVTRSNPLFTHRHLDTKRPEGQ